MLGGAKPFPIYILVTSWYLFHSTAFLEIVNVNLIL